MNTVTGLILGETISKVIQKISEWYEDPSSPIMSINCKQLSGQTTIVEIDKELYKKIESGVL